MYINFHTKFAASQWDRRAFVRHWRRIYRVDPRWYPPHHRALRLLISPHRSRFLTRLQPGFLQLEAYASRRAADNEHLQANIAFSGSLMEETVAAVALLGAANRSDRTAYLGLLHCVNDLECLDRLLDSAAEYFREAGYRRMVGPTALSPHLGRGLLTDSFDRVPPLHTPYNPPYSPELFARAMEPLYTEQLYSVPVSPIEPVAPTGIVTLRQAPFRQMAGKYAHLMQEVLADAEFPAPDLDEVRFMQRWTGVWPTRAWIAAVDNQPVGFLVLQGDHAPLALSTGGGRFGARTWLRWRAQRGARSGRLLWGGVRSAWRQQGIGWLLWQEMHRYAAGQGWQQVTIGPLRPQSAAAATLLRWGARPQQSYQIYQREF